MREKTINKRIFIWGTILGGFFGALVKWGSEINMPPRMPDEISPPGANINAWLGWLGINQHSLDYIYQGHLVFGAVTLYHWLFSFTFAFVYIWISAYFPKIRIFYGAFYGIIINVVMHWIIIPIFRFRIPEYTNGKIGWLWNMNTAEHWSEFLGHIYWSIVIEICLIAVLASYTRPIKGAWYIKKTNR